MEVAALLPPDAPPVLNAAGMIKSPDAALEALRTAVGAVLMGSFTLLERLGNEGQTYYGDQRGSLNSIGLASPSASEWPKYISDVRLVAADVGKLVWTSVAGFSAPECLLLADIALEAGSDVVEINLGCPNVWSDGKQKPILSFDAEAVSLICQGIADRATSDHPIGIKLSPLLDGALALQIQDILARTPPSFVTAINTIPNCFALVDDRPAISGHLGLAGMAGPAVKWLALGQVLQHKQALPTIPIVGVGGITSGKDVLDMMSPLVGASLCQIGTAFYDRGPRVFEEILQEMLALS